MKSPDVDWVLFRRWCVPALPVVFRGRQSANPVPVSEAQTGRGKYVRIRSGDERVTAHPGDVGSPRWSEAGLISSDLKSRAATNTIGEA